jgi:hypothetical protein
MVLCFCFVLRGQLYSSVFWACPVWVMTGLQAVILNLSTTTITCSSSSSSSSSSSNGGGGEKGYKRADGTEKTTRRGEEDCKQK